VKDKLGAEPGGEGKPEASHQQQQATEAVHNTITAQLQASGRNLASKSLLVPDSSICCYVISPLLCKEMLCINHHWESRIKAKASPQQIVSLSLHFTGTSQELNQHREAYAGHMSYWTCTSNTQVLQASPNR
jgi:hypothetical protein